MALQNQAAWFRTKGSIPQVGPAEIPSPDPTEIVIENKAVALHPGDWKLAKGIIPIPMQYPAIMGNYVVGIVHDVGIQVTRFKKGDRVLSMTALALRNDHRYGAHQRYSLSSAATTSKIGETSFDSAAHATSTYVAMSALVIHLGLNRPTKAPKPKDEKVLIWGGSSSVGFYAIQIAAQAGYKVITTASPANISRLKSAGAIEVLDYHSSNILSDLISLGPYKTIFGAAENATDQLIIGKVLDTQGGGEFLSTMGVRPGVTLPVGVKGFFVQYMDDYFKPELEEFRDWFFGEWQEWGLINRTIKLGDIEIIGGLDSLHEGLSRLEKGNVKSGLKLIIQPNSN